MFAKKEHEDERASRDLDALDSRMQFDGKGMQYGIVKKNSIEITRKKRTNVNKSEKRS